MSAEYLQSECLYALARLLDDQVASAIEKMLPFRDDLIDFTTILFKYQESVDLDRLYEFWERLNSIHVSTRTHSVLVYL